jgi:uncharacterized repeat protein (TIGR03803 family)
MVGKREVGPVSTLTLAILSALLLIAARPAQAQTETVLYNFCSQPYCADGAHPTSRLTLYNGNLYGTTSGAVFELSSDGSGGWKETVLHTFCPEYRGCGADPASSVTFDSMGNLYGTTEYGGTYGRGLVYELSPAGASWTETVLYNFPGGAEGALPVGGLIRDPAGNLYGRTTSQLPCQVCFGSKGPPSMVAAATDVGFKAGNLNRTIKGSGGGHLFELSPSGGGWTEQVLYQFETIPLGPFYIGYAGLTMDAAGNLFGASEDTVFELSPNGSGGWSPTAIHTFGAAENGSNPVGTPVLDQAGNVYGTTEGGGAYNSGTVYKLSPGRRRWTYEILYSFKSGPEDGSQPFAGIVFDAAGNIYGTTFSGGESGQGTVYELVAPVGTGSYTEKVLWSFNFPDGFRPVDSLILDSAGNLYGTTPGGGTGGGPDNICSNVPDAPGCGVIFEVTP